MARICFAQSLISTSYLPCFITEAISEGTPGSAGGASSNAGANSGAEQAEQVS